MHAPECTHASTHLDLYIIVTHIHTQTYMHMNTNLHSVLSLSPSHIHARTQTNKQKASIQILYSYFTTLANFKGLPLGELFMKYSDLSTSGEEIMKDIKTQLHYFCFILMKLLILFISCNRK